MLRPALCALLLALAPSLAVADGAWEWRSYPNGPEREVGFTLSPDWLILEGDASVEAVEAVMAKGEGLLVRVFRPIPGRTAIETSGLDRRLIRHLADELVRGGVAPRVWPVAARGAGVGFFDEQLNVAWTMSPDPKAALAHGVRLTRATNLPGVWRAEALDGDGIGAAWRMNGVPGVAWAEPDLIRDAITLELPPEPDIGRQWHLESDNDVGDIEVDRAWQTTSGDPEVVVGIFDNGFDMDHPDLQPNIVGGFDAANNDSDPESECTQQPDGAGPAPSCGGNAPYRESHGTAVAGVVAARGDNGLFGAGVCPDCSLFPVRLLGGGFRSISNAEAFQTATTGSSGSLWESL